MSHAINKHTSACVVCVRSCKIRWHGPVHARHNAHTVDVQMTRINRLPDCNTWKYHCATVASRSMGAAVAKSVPDTSHAMPPSACKNGLGDSTQAGNDVTSILLPGVSPRRSTVDQNGCGRGTQNIIKRHPDLNKGT